MSEQTVSSLLAQLLLDKKDGVANARTIFKQAFLADAVDSLFHARHYQGLTPEQMAEQIGVTREEVLRLEGDTTGSMTLHQYADIAIAYDMVPMIAIMPVEQARQEAIRRFQEEGKQ